MQRKTKMMIAGVSAVGLTALALGGYAVADSRHGGMGHGMMEGHGRGFGMMRMAENFAERYDTNKDGKITQEEIDTNRTQWMNEADANKDGKLGMDEFQTVWLRAHRERMVREFQHFDRDGDAAVTLDEYRRPLNNVVTAMDQNNDGVLSQDDLKQYKERRGWGQRMRNWMQGRGEGMGPGMMGDGDGDGDATGSTNP
jgi:Ca2+-binding EF-hand superfamily protein